MPSSQSTKQQHRERKTTTKTLKGDEEDFNPVDAIAIVQCQLAQREKNGQTLSRGLHDAYKNAYIHISYC